MPHLRGIFVDNESSNEKWKQVNEVHSISKKKKKNVNEVQSYQIRTRIEF